MKMMNFNNSEVSMLATGLWKKSRAFGIGQI